MTPLAAAIAFETASAQQRVTEEVIVTTEFREENVQDVPVAVTAVNAEMLEARSQTNIVQVSAQAPNVQLSSFGQDGGSAMLATIRGVGQLDFNYSQEPGVGLYVDDVYYPNLNGSMVELLDLERVEVLRGPQGTLAGRNSIGGAIKLYSREPGRDNRGSMQLSVGSYDRVDLKAAADFTLIEDKLYMRGAGVSRSRDGYITRLDYKCMNPSSPLPTYSRGDLQDCTLGTLGGESYTAGRFTLLYQPSDSLEIKFIGDLTNTENESSAMNTVQVNEPTNRTNGNNGEGIYYDPDGNPATTDDRIYYSNEFVTFGTYRPDDAVVNDPYVTYSTFIDPNAPLPNRPYSPSAIDPGAELTQRGGSLHIDWDISDQLNLLWISSLRSYTDTWSQDTDGSPLHQQFLTQTLRHRHYTNEIRFNGVSFGDAVDWTLGYFHVDQDRATHEGIVNLPYSPLHFIHGPDKTPSDSKALFAHMTWYITDSVELSLGVRDTDDDKSYTFRRRNPDGSPIDQPCDFGLPFGPANTDNPNSCVFVGLDGASADFSSSTTDRRVALSYHVSDDVMVYFQNATGYKAGGLNPRPFNPSQQGGFNPEDVEVYEVGFKTLFADGRVRLNGAVFSSDYNNIIQILTTIDGGPAAKPVNAGNGESDGVELELEAYITDRLLFDMSASTLDFQYTSIDPATGITLDMTTPWTPENTWSAGIQYQWPVANGGSVTVRMDASYQDDVVTDSINLPQNVIESYTVSNLRVTWRSASEDWEAALEVTNASDQLYFNNLFEQWNGSGMVGAGIAAPRMTTVHVKRSFSL